MNIITIRSEGIASLSYIIISDNEALVIDPRRDAQIYVSYAKEHQASITHIFETHRHEDFVTGSLELKQHVLLAKMGHSKETAFEFGDLWLKDGDTFQIGQMEVECIHTPGHTDDSICYILSDLSIGPDPIVIFTGDTLFVNEVGRTDLVDIQKHELMSRKLFHTLHDKVMQLEDGVIVYPGHGAGSVCGGKIAFRDFSTIGYERKNNFWLSLNEEEFVRRKVNQKLTRASYFKKCEKLNTIGPPIIANKPEPKILSPGEFADLMVGSAFFAIDTRTPLDFVLGHVPNSVNITLEALGQIAGWILEYTVNILLIVEDMEQTELVRNLLFRLGFDRVYGVLENGIAGWQSSDRPLATLETILPSEINQKISSSTVLLDVREEYESEQEPLNASRQAPMTNIRTHLETFDRELGYIASCTSGYRSTAVASLMARYGFKNVGVIQRDSN